MIGENIDIAPICPYVQDDRRRIPGTNRQYYFNDFEKKWVIDINFLMGSLGHDSYKTCRDNVRKNYAQENRCAIA